MAMVPHERSLVERLKDKPFVLLGVNGDQTLAQARDAITEHRINWRSWVNTSGKDGPITSQFNVRGFPSIFLIDAQGRLRYSHVGFLDPQTMDWVVDQLLAEAESK